MNIFLLKEIVRSTKIYDLSVADDNQDYIIMSQKHTEMWSMR